MISGVHNHQKVAQLRLAAEIAQNVDQTRARLTART